MNAYTWFLAHAGVIFGFLFGLSEVIGKLPGVQASGVFQAISNSLKWLVSKFPSA